MSALQALRDFAQSMTANLSGRIDAQPEDQLKPAVIMFLKAVSQDFGQHLSGRTEARNEDVQDLNDSEEPCFLGV